jgi:hypothetical protein
MPVHAGNDHAGDGVAAYDAASPDHWAYEGASAVATGAPAEEIAAAAAAAAAKAAARAEFDLLKEQLAEIENRARAMADTEVADSDGRVVYPGVTFRAHLTQMRIKLKSVEPLVIKSVAAADRGLELHMAALTNLYTLQAALEPDVEPDVETKDEEHKIRIRKACMAFLDQGAAAVHFGPAKGDTVVGHDSPGVITLSTRTRYHSMAAEKLRTQSNANVPLEWAREVKTADLYSATN